MKTPTPEEVKDRVAVKYGYQDWQHLNFTHFNNYFDGLNVGQKAKVRKEYMVYENEAMRDYAEALYKDRIEKAGSELPSEGQFEDWKEINSTKSLDYEGSTVDPTSYQTYEWMKQAASVVIEKNWEREKNLCDELFARGLNSICELNKIIIQKDKEIEELNDRIKMLNTMLNFHINKP